jgi:pimeloyl-ACP methyl ester carboxylesterase
MYGGRTDDGELGFDVSQGIHLEKIGKLNPSRVLSEEVYSFILRIVATYYFFFFSMLTTGLALKGNGFLYRRICSTWRPWSTYVSVPLSLVEYHVSLSIHTTVKWYRTRKVNYEDELNILDRKITAPLLFIQALKDIVLPPEMGRSMSRDVPNLTVEQVNTTHWALWEDPVGVNNILSTWLAEHVPRAVDSIL